MLRLYLQAPFAVFRPFTTGSFRPTAGFITPSAAYGLLLNVAGIEMRLDDGKSVMTAIKNDLPKVRLALGALEMPLRHSIYQQLHNYPVGTTGKDHAVNTWGNKYNILPVRRQFLSGIRAYLCLNGNPDLETWVLEGLAGKRPRTYGLPFLGDNNFLIDRLEPVPNPQPSHWFVPVERDQEEFQEDTTRLTLTIDRRDMSLTRSKLFAPTREKSLNPPDAAWQEVQY
ncbi:MAG: CRISPR-associated protein Cas5 [Desulfobacterales bacterium]|nr:CRISPR-associated protein Cas5 [Pseudomonadota bacterium]MBU4356748.1 CRISPR-associated protein Cas5 [Pseudomonadota bacterium]MCG2770955.1 CRISPR-associated protein Cas5 [Desulfobacterales bacterium]